MLHGVPWRVTKGAAPDAVKAARPVLNGEDEETGLRVLRLVLTQHHRTGKVLAYVFGRRKDNVFLKLQQLLAPFGTTKFYTDGGGAYERQTEAEKHQAGKEHTQKIDSKHIHRRARLKPLLRRTISLSKTE